MFFVAFAFEKDVQKLVFERQISEHKLGRFASNIIWNKNATVQGFFPLINYFTCCTMVRYDYGYDYLSLSMEKNKYFTNIECLKFFSEEVFLRGRIHALVFAFIVISCWLLGPFLTC